MALSVEEATKHKFLSDLENAQRQLNDVERRVTEVQDSDGKLKERKRALEEIKVTFCVISVFIS